jgi:WD40 repeat protein
MISFISSPVLVTSTSPSLRDLIINTLMKTVLNCSLGESLSQVAPDKVPYDIIELLRQALIQRYRVLLLNITNSCPSTVLIGNNDQVLSVAFSPDGKFALTGSWDIACLWNIEDKDTIQSYVLNGHTGVIVSVAFSLDGKFALTGSGDNTARLWNLVEPLISMESLTLPMILLIIKLDQNAQDNNQILTQKHYSETFNAFTDQQLKEAIITYFKLEPVNASSSNSN